MSITGPWLATRDIPDGTLGHVFARNENGTLWLFDRYEGPEGEHWPGVHCTRCRLGLCSGCVENGTAQDCLEDSDAWLAGW